MIQRVAAIVIKEGKILLMRRRKAGREYFAIPGGRIESGETSEKAALRELKEETNLDAEIGSLLFENEADGWHNHFYLAKNADGEARFGGEELERNSEDDHYELMWVELAKLPDANLLPKELKDRLVEKFLPTV